MKLGEVFQSIDAWRSLSAVKMKPAMAIRIMRYIKLVSGEWEICEAQRVALIREITDTQDGQDATIDANTPDAELYVARFNEIMELESSLSYFGVSLEEVMDCVRESEGNELSVSDLATLEPFFSGSEKEQPEVAGKIGPSE
jgi:hypothetical protein